LQTTQLHPAHEFVARHVCWLNVWVSESYEKPRHAFDPPQCGCVSRRPFAAVHSAVNCATVRLSTMVEVTMGLGDTPPSHSVSGMGVSPSTGVVPPVLDELDAEAPPVPALDDVVVPVVLEVDPELAAEAPPVPELVDDVVAEVEVVEADPLAPVPELLEAEPVLVWPPGLGLELLQVADAKHRRPLRAAARSALLAPWEDSSEVDTLAA
jgi:hypothetical protein